MRKAENGEARRIIDAAAAVAVDIDEGEIADWWGRLVAEPTIHLRAGACRQRAKQCTRETEVPPGGLVRGNHELWTTSDEGPGVLRGAVLYERLVRIAHPRGVLTPEDPYPVVELPEGPVLVAPLFLPYDYSFRPPHVGRDEVVARARETAAACSDEWMLHPELFPDRESWCAARNADAVDQLASSPADLPKVLVNHSSARGAARRAAAHPPLHPLVRDPKDPQLAPPIQRVGRRLRPSPHPGIH